MRKRVTGSSIICVILDTERSRSSARPIRIAVSAVPGTEVDPGLVLYMKDDIEAFTPANGYAVTKELLETGREFTALFTMSDTTAIGACKALLEAGKRVPEDYSVVGFDGIDMALYYHPSLTTICQPKEEMARASIKMLLDLIEEHPVKNNQQIFKAELRPGESTQEL